MENLTITVGDVMQRELFQHAELIAGEKGVDRDIKWTHILEMETFDSFINGGELILTTGSKINFESAEGVPQVDKLIERGVAGLCIEQGPHFNQMDDKILKLAQKHDFPIIVFKKTVRFVDITQDIHTLIINNHHTQLQNLHSLSKELDELSLEPNGIIKILKKVYTHFKKRVILVTDESELYYYPLKDKVHAENILSLIDAESKNENHASVILYGKAYTVFSIKGLGHSWGHLYFQQNPDDIDEFSFSLLDRATLAIAQVLLRNRTIEERKQNLEGDLVKKLIHEESYDASMAQKFLPFPAENLYYRLIIIEKKSISRTIRGEESEETKLAQAMFIRKLFNQFGFTPAISVNINNIIVISSFYKNKENNEHDANFKLLAEAILHSHNEDIIKGKEYYVSASSLNQDYTLLSDCYREANEVTHLKKSGVVNDVLYYENLGVFHVLTKMDQSDLQSLINTYLGPLLEFEKKTKNSNLLLTLSVYLETMGSKKETSDRLYIVRQTLYYRLEKISGLLGKDYLEPANRQAIELAINANKLLNKKV